MESLFPIKLQAHKVILSNIDIRLKSEYTSLPDDYQLFLYTNSQINDYIKHLSSFDKTIVTMDNLLPDWEHITYECEDYYEIANTQFLMRPNVTPSADLLLGYFNVSLAKKVDDSISEPETYPINPRWSHSAFDGGGARIMQITYTPIIPEHAEKDLCEAVRYAKPERPRLSKHDLLMLHSRF